MLKLFPLLTIFIMVISCSSIVDKKVDYIIYGVVCGECSGHCATMYKVDNKFLVRDTSDNYFHNRTKLESGFISGDTLNKANFDEAKTLKEKLPDILLTSSEEKYGNPDNHDQCGIYIQFKIGNQIKTFDIDTDLDKIPADLRDYVERIMKLTREY